MATQNPLLPKSIEPKPLQDKTHAEELFLFEKKIEDGPLAVAYRELMEEGWKWRDAAYIAWMTLPKAHKQPKTKQEFCDLIGISTTALRRRLLANPTVEQRIKVFRLSALEEESQAVIQNLIEGAKKPDYKYFNHLKLFLELSGDYTPKQAIDLTPMEAKKPADMTEAELRQLAMKRIESGEE